MPTYLAQALPHVIFPNFYRKTNGIAEVTKIRPYLLLCGATALRGTVLEDLGVTAVVNATQELPDTPLPDGEILYLRVNVGDRADTDILQWMDIVADLIHQVRLAGGKTLIHCVAGVSRSAALCLAYLVKYEDLSLLDAYKHLKSLRQIVRPNVGFFGQLVEFERRVSGRQTVAMVYSDFAHSCIPHLYEDDYRRKYLRLCSRV